MSEAAVSIPQSDRSPEPDTNEQTRAGYPHARPPERLRATTRMVTVINASARARRVPVSVRYVPGVDPDPPVAPTRYRSVVACRRERQRGAATSGASAPDPHKLRQSARVGGASRRVAHCRAAVFPFKPL
jgi:hypothetical protein